MNKLLLIFLLTLFSAFGTFAQIGNVISKLHGSKADFKKLDLFSIQENSSSLKNILQTQQLSDKVTLLNINQNTLNMMLNKPTNKISFSVPSVYHRQSLELELIRVNIEAPNMKVVAISDTKADSLEPIKMVHYQGIIKGDKKSIVAITISEFGMSCMLSDSTGNMELNKTKDTETYFFTYSKFLPTDTSPLCGTADLSDVKINNSTEGLFINNGTATGCKVLRIHIYVDYDYYLYCDSSIPRTSASMISLFNKVALLYRQEGIAIQLSSLSVHTSPTQYPASTSASAMLNIFTLSTGTANFIGDLTMLVVNGTNRMTDADGIAWLQAGGICDNNRNHNKGVAQVSFSSFYGLPQYNRDVEVFAHEMGHLLGSNHTHWCGWPGKALDNCAPPEGNCIPGPAPTNGGTIMSYCDSDVGPGVNFSNGFGAAPGSQIRNGVSSQYCVVTTNAAPTNLATTTYNYSPSEVTLDWTDPITTNSMLYEVRYRKVGDPTWIVISNIDDITLTLTGLYSQVNYEWSVRTECSGYPASNYFTTPVNAVLNISSLSNNTICANTHQSIGITTYGVINTNNSYIIQLSDINGGFTNPKTIGSVQSSQNNEIIDVLIPPNTEYGNSYKMRVSSTSPSVIGQESTTMTINPIPPTPTLNMPIPKCAGESTTISTSCAGTSTVLWSNGSNSNSITVSPSVSTDYSAFCVSTIGCKSITATEKIMVIPSGTQNLVKLWDKSFGGTGDDVLLKAIPTSDGGYLLGGYSNSNSYPNGGKTDNSQGLIDFYIVKVDKNGNKQWDKTYGGTYDDALRTMIELPDGKFLLGGFSFSGTNGDRTAANRGNADFWVVKINADGSKISDWAYGGANNDDLYDIKSTADGGFLLAGYSDSVLGNGASGDRSDVTTGGFDFWVVKINSLGIKQWDKAYGGTLNEYIESIALTPDGGFLLGGLSASDASPKKTATLRGGEDMWLVKINSVGVKEWDKAYGGINNEGLRCIKATSDGNFLLSGYSASSIGFEKTENIKGAGDIWIVKIKPDGSIIKDKTLGGELDDDGLSTDVIETPDGGFLIAGYSKSNIVSDKSEVSRGGTDYWLLKIDTNLEKIWDKTYGGSNNDYCYSMLGQSNGDVLLAGYSLSPISNDRTQVNPSALADFWIVKTNVSGIQPTIVPNPSTPLNCPGDALTLTVNGCSVGGNILWSNAATTNTISVNPLSSDLIYKVSCPISSCLNNTSANYKPTFIASNLNISGIASNGIQRGLSSIVSSQFIEYGINTNYQASKYIELSESFSSQFGSFFRADIVANCPITDGLVASYNMDNNVNDQSGNGHNATFTNTTVTTGRKGNVNGAYSFNGTNQSIHLGTWFRSQEFTVSMWLNAASTQNNAYAMIVDNNHGGNISFSAQQDFNTTNQYYFAVGGTPTYGYTGFSLIPNQWEHIVLVKGNGFIKVYKNGNLLGSATHSGLIDYTSTTPALCLGAYVNNGNNIRYWAGKMDDVKIYNRAISPVEVSYLYAE